MNIFQKHLAFLNFSLLIIVCLGLFTNSLVAIEIDEVQAKKLGNFLDNAFANMNEEEKEMFMQEVQHEQEKLMAMSPEERAAREEQVARELDQLMNNSPYGEWFEKPAAALLPQPVNPIESEKLPDTSKINSSDVETKTKNSPKVKTDVIPAEIKARFKKIIQDIVHAIDIILLKTNNMQQIQHLSWNHGKWHELEINLRNLKTDLQMTINSNAILADFIKKEQATLQSNIQNFAALITKQADALKTPDAMGLVVVFEGQPKIIDQALYDESILKLKNMTDILGNELNRTRLTIELKKLLTKFQPVQKPTALNDKRANRSSKNTTNCKPSLNKELLIQETKAILDQLKICVNLQLLELAQQYQATYSLTIKRKLQWRLSELELHLHRLVKVIKATPNCQEDLKSIIKESLASSQIHDLLNRLFLTLDKITTTNELNGLINQLRTHKAIISI